MKRVKGVMGKGESGKVCEKDLLTKDNLIPASFALFPDFTSLPSAFDNTKCKGR